MWRYVAGGVAALLLAAAGVFLFSGRASPDHPLPVSPAQAQAAADTEAMDDAVPEAAAKTREEKRFGRYDKDKDGSITREEYLAARRKAYAKLDTNGDGRLSFDEWAIKTTTKFATADTNHDGTMTPAEFQKTAVKRMSHIKRDCPRVPVQTDGADES